MDSADRLIEYYFQRKIAGMPSTDIHQSLKQQMLEEEERDVIVSQVEHKEALYLKALKRHKLGKTILGVGLSLLIVSIGFLAYSIVSHYNFLSPILIYGLLGIGGLAVTISFFLFPKEKISVFKS